MAATRIWTALLTSVTLVHAVCPYMGDDASGLPAHHPPVRRDNTATPTDEFLAKYEIDDQDSYLTSDVGGPFSDQNSLSAGERGPTLLEDFIFRQKITHFDHERVPERAVHARGAGAHGVFQSYGDHSNLTAASFLGSAEKETPVFIRFSTVAGSRGSADTVRDVHGFAVRFYTDEGNYDIVGNNIPVFFIQDAIQFPDLIHAVKPKPDREIPQAATAHDTAWDFFSQQPSSLHTLMWAMSGHGTVRSFRHMDGWGVHTFRFVTDDGKTKLVKFRFQSMQGKASLLWEEAQAAAGKNADFHRQDLFDSIDKGRFPEWEFQAQILEEEDQLKYGFDVLDPTKIVPEDLVPFTPLGKLTLNRNPRNYFAETEQVMFQPAHIVRGVDFTDDPLLQGRLFSYLDTQINRHGGPNFEQLPINQPRVPIHNNNRDGAGQMFIPLNTAAYSPNTMGSGPKQANQTAGNGFFTAPGRTSSGKLVRTVSSSFADVWSQPRLFFNSLTATEQQNIVNAMRFETSQLQSSVVKNNVLIQLNRISHDLATRVATAIGMTAPDADSTYYHDNTTIGVSVEKGGLNKTDGLKVGWLTSNAALQNSSAAAASKKELEDTYNADLVVVAETLAEGVDQTYSASDAIQFDAIYIADGTANLFQAPKFGNSTQASSKASTLYPPGRPLQIVMDSFRYGKSVAATGSGATALDNAGIPKNQKGVFVDGAASTNALSNLGESLLAYKWYDRFAMDS